MQIVINEIAEAIKQRLAALDLLEGIPVQRAYIPVYDVESENGKKVFVLPQGYEETTGRTREKMAYKATVFVVLMQKILRGNQVQDCDALITLMGQMVGELMGLTGVTSYGANVMACNPSTLYVPDSLDQGLFQSVITCELSVLI